MSQVCPIYRRKDLQEKPSKDTALGFGKYFTDHMFTMDYSPEEGWNNAKIEAFAPISMSPASMVLHYSQTIFEGMKAYRRSDGGINLFRPKLNFERLNVSAERIAIPPIDTDFVLACLKELILLDESWVPSSEGTSLYIRPFIFATDAFLGVSASKTYKFMIILSPVGSYYQGGLKPTSIFVEDHYVRAVRGGIGAAKTGGNYAASIKSQVDASKQSFDQVLWLDGIERRYIEEVGAMNVFFVKGNTLLTPQLTGSILPGITRRSVIELAGANGYDIEERQIAIEELFELVRQGKVQEAFGSGTAAVISPIGQMMYDGEVVHFGDGTPGPVASRIYQELTGIQYGLLEDPFAWAMPLN